jgi:hypothetical protein
MRKTTGSMNAALSNSSLITTEFTDLVSSNQYDTSKFASLFADRCPSYSLIACKMRGEMRLWVLCLKGLKEEVDDVYVSYTTCSLDSLEVVGTEEPNAPMSK